MIRFLLILCVLAFTACSVAAQQVILTTREQQSLKALMGPSGELEQLILKEVSTFPLSTVGHARMMADIATHTLRCSFNGGAYGGCTSGGGTAVGGSGVRGRPATWTNVASTVTDSTFYTDVRAGWGAVCDGTNQAGPIEAAIAAGAKRIYIPSGCMWQPTGNTVTGTDIEIIGEDWNSVTIQSSAPTTVYLQVTNNVRLSNVRVRHKYCYEEVPPLNSDKYCQINTYQNTSGATRNFFNWPRTALYAEVGGSDQGSTEGDRGGIQITTYGFGDAIFAQTLGSDAPAIRVFGSGVNDNIAAVNISRFTTVPGLQIETGGAGAATGSDFVISTPHRTTGQMLNLFHRVSDLIGTGLLMNFGTGGGSFGGLFANFQKDSVSLWSVDSSGSTHSTAFVGQPDVTDTFPGNIQFRELVANGTNSVGFIAPTSVPLTILWRLPAGDGPDTTCFSTDGALTLSFRACLAGTLTAGRVPFASAASAVLDDPGFTWDNAIKSLILNAAGGFTGSYAAFQLAGAERFNFVYNGNLVISGVSTVTFTETGGGTDTVAIKAPAVVTAPYSIELPSAVPVTSAFLKMSTGGVLSTLAVGLTTTFVVACNPNTQFRTITLVDGLVTSTGTCA